MSLHTDENGAVTLGKDRHALCMEAAWELESLGYLLPNLKSNSDQEAAQSGFVVRAIASRCVTLANALTSALGDDAEKTYDVARVVHVLPIKALP